MTPNQQQRKLLKEQKDRARKLDPEHLECRVGGIRHAWSRRKPDFEAPTGQVARAEQCTRCHMVKRITFGAKYGEIISRTYQAPDGYYLKRGEEVGRLMSPAAVRLVLSETATEDLPPIDELRSSSADPAEL